MSTLLNDKAAKRHAFQPDTDQNCKVCAYPRGDDIHGNYGRLFRLIGCTEVFKVVHETHDAHGCGIHAVTGWTLDARRQTQPRVVDIVWLDDCEG